jgi:hypothetical protein
VSRPRTRLQGAAVETSAIAALIEARAKVGGGPKVSVSAVAAELAPQGLDALAVARLLSRRGLRYHVLDALFVQVGGDPALLRARVAALLAESELRMRDRVAAAAEVTAAHQAAVRDDRVRRISAHCAMAALPARDFWVHGSLVPKVGAIARVIESRGWTVNALQAWWRAHDMTKEDIRSAGPEWAGQAELHDRAALGKRDGTPGDRLWFTLLSLRGPSAVDLDKIEAQDAGFCANVRDWLTTRQISCADWSGLSRGEAIRVMNGAPYEEVIADRAAPGKPSALTRARIADALSRGVFPRTVAVLFGVPLRVVEEMAA